MQRRFRPPVARLPLPLLPLCSARGIVACSRGCSVVSRVINVNTDVDEILKTMKEELNAPADAYHIPMNAVVGASASPECKTMNDLMKKGVAGVVFEPFKMDVPIADWAALSRDRKRSLHPAAHAIDALLKDEILLELSSSLCDYHQKLTVGEVDEDLHCTLRFKLEHVLEAWIYMVVDTPDKSDLKGNRALASRLETAVFTRKDPAKPFEWLGADKKKLKMLGRDDQMTTAMEAMAFIGPNAKQPLERQKEKNKIVYVVAGPRQGKSLLLDCLAEQVDLRGHASLTMTFNSPTKLEGHPISRDQAMREFWGRLLGSLTDRVNGCTTGNGFNILKASGLLAVVTPELVAAAMKRVFPRKRLMIGVDEFSKLLRVCPPLRKTAPAGAVETQAPITGEIFTNHWALVCSGFASTETRTTVGIDGRPVEEVSLLATLSNELAPLRNDVWASVHTPEDAVAYQCAKAVPGVMGAFLYQISDGHRSLGNFLHSMPFTRNIAGEHSEITSLLLEVWTLSNAAFDCATRHADSIHVKLQEVGVGLDSILVDKDGDIRAVTTFHPVALYAFAAKTSPTAQAPHINTVVEAVQELFEALRAIPFRVVTSAKGTRVALGPLRKRNECKGKCLETSIAVALRIRASIPGKHSDVNSLIESACGGYLPTPHSSAMKQRDKQLKLKPVPALLRVEDFRVSAPIVLDAFPGGPNHTLSDVEIRKLNDELERHFATSPFATITMTSSSTNPGCDVALIGNLANGERVLILYEAKHYFVKSILRSEGLAEKVELCLHGVSRIEKNLNISRVCFVFCAPSCARAPRKFRKSSVGMRAAVTLHMVRSDAAWRHLMLHTFQWLLPAVDGDREHRFGKKAEKTVKAEKVAKGAHP